MPEISKKPAPVKASQSVSDAFATILRHNLDYLLQWEELAHSADDIEGVHQVRVTFRRMRSALVLFRNAVPKAVSAHWNAEMRWLAGQMGMARDLDVFLTESLKELRGKLPLEGEDKLIEVTDRRRRIVYRDEVCAMLDGERFAQFKEGFAHWIDTKAWESAELKKKQKKNLHMELLLFSRLLLDKQERKVLTRGTGVSRHTPEEMHRLRIECKKLRYAAEFFSPLFKGMDKFIGHMKGLQDLLGIMNDVAVLQKLLVTLLADTEDQQVPEYAGGVVGWKSCEFYQLLDSFDSRWSEFSEAGHPWWK